MELKNDEYTLNVTQDLISKLVEYFSKSKQGRVSETDIESKLYVIKKSAVSLGFNSAEQVIQQALAGNTKCINSLESTFLRPHMSFFEGAGMYKVFENSVFPSLINKNQERKSLSVWVPGCTEGKEAYSLGLLLNSHQEEFPDWKFSIMATDTNNEDLKKAESATYDEELIEDVILKLYGSGLRRNGHEYIINKPVRDLITFQYDNFYESNTPEAAYDVIIFRNHLKKWLPPLQEKIIKNFAARLQPNGYLILGSDESILGVSNSFTSMDACRGFYQKNPGYTKYI